MNTALINYSKFKLNFQISFEFLQNSNNDFEFEQHFWNLSYNFESQTKLYNFNLNLSNYIRKQCSNSSTYCNVFETEIDVCLVVIVLRTYDLYNIGILLQTKRYITFLEKFSP